MSKGPFLRKYGVQTTILFDLFEVDGVDFRVDAVHSSGDTKIMKDEGAEANTTNGFTDEGQSYSIVLDATEMQAARIKVLIVDSATKVWLDTSITVETYGNASAMHAFDFDTAVQNVNVASTDDIGLSATQKSNVNAECDTALVDYDAPTSAELVSEIDSVQTDIAALNDFNPTAQLTESYAANGVAPTSAQLWFAVHQMLMQFGVSGVNLTVRKLNNIDAAFVVTLDSATDPTDAKRI